MGSDQPEMQRLACISLLRCFQSVIAALPDNIRSNISVQVSDFIVFLFYDAFISKQTKKVVKNV